MGDGLVTEHQLYQPGVLLSNLQEWVLQGAHLGVHLGSFSGVKHWHPSLSPTHFLKSIDVCYESCTILPHWYMCMLAQLHLRLGRPFPGLHDVVSNSPWSGICMPVGWFLTLVMGHRGTRRVSASMH